MASIKKTAVLSLTALGLGFAGLGAVSAVSAATTDSSTGQSSIVDKIASKFGLDKEKVQAVFDEEHEARHAEMEAKRTEALKQAVTEGDLSQAQADHITTVWKEIETLKGDTAPRDVSDETRDAMKEKMDALRTWADEQGIDLKEIIGFGAPHNAHGGHGGPGFGGPREDKASNTTTESN